jgi:hypothetical protein
LSFGRARRPFLRGEGDQDSNALLVDRRERIVGEDAALDVAGQEARSVVAGECVGHLRQVVGPEREEVGRKRDAIGGERRARHLDHGTDRERHADSRAREAGAHLLEHERAQPLELRQRGRPSGS